MDETPPEKSKTGKKIKFLRRRKEKRRRKERGNSKRRATVTPPNNRVSEGPPPIETTRGGPKKVGSSEGSGAPLASFSKFVTKKCAQCKVLWRTVANSI